MHVLAQFDLMEWSERVDRLQEAYAAYVVAVSPHYDEVLEEVIERTRASGALGKLDIAGLTGWKRLQGNTRWMAALMSAADDDVRQQTAVAVQRANDVSLSTAEAAAGARRALSGLPGFTRGDALASAVCLAAAPHRLAVYDQRAHRALIGLGLQLDDQPGRYGRYIQLVEQCRAELVSRGLIWTARQVDQALYQLSG